VIVVPDVVAMSWDEARRVGEQAGLWVTGPDLDGPPLPALAWPGGVVVRQQPRPGELADEGSQLIIWVERPPGSAGVREPRRPPPKRLDAHADNFDPTD
jgi:beta-lactam-binding protein with PASTA domain